MTGSPKKRILVVDDEPHIVELVKVSLESESFDIFQAYDGEEGLRLAVQDPPDLILLDVQMPKLDGYQVCSALRSDEKTRTIPILILSSKSHPVDKQRGKECGATAYLTKPFSPLKLLAVVKENVKNDLAQT